MTKPKRPTPDDYAERDLKLLQFVHRMRIGLAACISLVLFDGKDCRHVLRRLADAGLLDLHDRAIAGNISYVTLTKQGFKKIGIYDRKPKEVSNVVLNLAIALNWYCTLEGTRRFWLFPSEVKEHFGQESNLPHVLNPKEGDEPAVFRVYHARGELKLAKNQVEQFFQATGRKKPFAAAISSLDYGVLVLAPTEDKRIELTEAFHQADFFSRGRLLTGLGPTEETLAPLLRKRGNGDE